MAKQVIEQLEGHVCRDINGEETVGEKPPCLPGVGEGGRPSLRRLAHQAAAWVTAHTVVDQSGHRASPVVPSDAFLLCRSSLMAWRSSPAAAASSRRAAGDGGAG